MKVIDYICGNGIRNETEEWDDGNNDNKDGCNSECKLETGYIWKWGSYNQHDIWTENCGDGIKFNSKTIYWDDGNKDSGDGCNSSWTIETGWSWTGGTTNKADIWAEIWGDGKRFNSNTTYWDDGNKDSGDGCNSSWTIETGWSWTGGTTNKADIWAEIWGDGKRFNSNTTYWDDGNKDSGDGCNSSWTIETGWSWTGGTTNKADIWAEIWGDGKRFNSNTTYWDDGNKDSGDGCNSSWTIETGWSWTGGTTNKADIWAEIWGDGKRFNSNTTYWDDGNKDSGDGCNSSWTIETGWSWNGGSDSSDDSWTEICGDGKRFNSNFTYWDDQNLNNGDGWSSTCNVDNGYICTGGSSTSKDIWNIFKITKSV